MKAIFFIVGALSLFSISGCGESPEEAAFRKELVDKALNDDTRKEGEAFLNNNREQTGVVVTQSGLQYRIIESGSGKVPNRDDRVLVHYEGRLVNGQVFDSSYQREKPSNFPVKQLIKGWQEALLSMPVGSLWEVYIHPDLAYGATSPQPSIPANSTLIFKVNLLDIAKEDAASE